MAFKSRARVRDPPRLDDGFIHGEGTSSEGGLACLPVTMYERILTMRKMRLMRRAAPPARAAHEMAMRNMRWMRRAARAAA